VREGFPYHVGYGYMDYLYILIIIYLYIYYYYYIKEYNSAQNRLNPWKIKGNLCVRCLVQDYLYLVSRVLGGRETFKAFSRAGFRGKPRSCFARANSKTPVRHLFSGDTWEGFKGKRATPRFGFQRTSHCFENCRKAGLGTGRFLPRHMGGGEGCR
jgi:hypothetical protein